MARRRTRKQKNPKDNHAGLGAFLGSLVGGVPGHIMTAVGLESLGGVMTGVGWIGGGALGGYYGASTDRRGRAAIGGAIGGIFTPLGAALGGYLGGRKPDKKRNPSTAVTLGTALGLGLLAVGGGYALYRVTDGGKRMPKLPGGSSKVDPADALQGILGNSTLEEATFLVADVQQPILLQARRFQADGEFASVPQLRVMVEDPSGMSAVEDPAGARFGTLYAATIDDNELTLVGDDGDVARYATAKKAISYLVTGLSPEAARIAYELALIQIGNKGVNWDDPQARDEAIKAILSAMASKVDWSRGLQPYAYGDAPTQAWIGVQIIGTVAHQSFFNKRVLQETNA